MSTALYAAMEPVTPRTMCGEALMFEKGTQMERGQAVRAVRKRHLRGQAVHAPILRYS